MSGLFIKQTGQCGMCDEVGDLMFVFSSSCSTERGESVVVGSGGSVADRDLDVGIVTVSDRDAAAARRDGRFRKRRRCV